MYYAEEETTGCCTNNFYSLQQIMEARDTVDTPSVPVQALYPALRLGCSGNLSEIIYRTSPGGSLGREVIDIWRETSPGSNVYQLFQVISRNSEVLFGNIEDEEEEVYLYSVRDLDISVQADDFIGFAGGVPSTLKFADLGNDAPESIYLFFLDNFLITINLDSVTAYDRRYFPLLTAVIARKSEKNSIFECVVIWELIEWEYLLSCYYVHTIMCLVLHSSICSVLSEHSPFTNPRPAHHITTHSFNFNPNNPVSNSNSHNGRSVRPHSYCSDSCCGVLRSGAGSVSDLCHCLVLVIRHEKSKKKPEQAVFKL